MDKRDENRGGRKFYNSKGNDCYDEYHSGYKRMCNND